MPSRRRLSTFDIDPAEIDKNVKTDVAVLGRLQGDTGCRYPIAGTRQTIRNGLDSFRQYEEVEEEKVIRPELHPAGKALSMGEVVRAVSEATDNEADIGD